REVDALDVLHDRGPPGVGEHEAVGVDDGAMAQEPEDAGLVAQPPQEPFGIGPRRLGQELERHHLREPARAIHLAAVHAPATAFTEALEDAVATTLQWNPETDEPVSEGTLESP